MLAADVDALLEEARCDMARDRLDIAQDKCMQVLHVHGRHPGALSLLGTVLYSLGRHEDSVRVFNALTLMEPDVAEHWSNLGTSLRPTRRYDQAIAAFDRALRLAKPNAALLYNLGILQLERYDYNAAYLALRDAVALSPADATVRWGFAQCCYNLVNHEEALEALDEWQSLDGLNTDLTIRIVFLLVMLGAGRDAAPAIERLIADPPIRGPGAISLASILERLHRLDEARAIMDRMPREEVGVPADPERLLMLSVLADRAGESETALQHLSMALEQHREFMHQYHLLYRVAKIMDASGRYEEAFGVAAEAHRSQLEYIDVAMGKLPQQESRILLRASRRCDPDDVVRWGRDGPSIDGSPIFVVGFPRSGTTLLEQVLDAHPLLQSMDEQAFLQQALGEITDRGIADPTGLGALTTGDLDELRAGYWRRVARKVNLATGQRLVDKNPLSMLMLPLIRRLFPNARIILAIRHPCDVLLSCYLQNFRAPELALLCRDLPTLANAYARAFEFWYSQWPLLEPCSYELRYERLTEHFDAEVRSLADFLALPWNAAMLRPGESARAKGFVSTPSYAQILEPVTNRSVGRWQHYKSHFLDILPILEPWLARWGYDAG